MKVVLIILFTLCMSLISHPLHGSEILFRGPSISDVKVNDHIWNGGPINTSKGVIIDFDYDPLLLSDSNYMILWIDPQGNSFHFEANNTVSNSGRIYTNETGVFSILGISYADQIYQIRSTDLVFENSINTEETMSHKVEINFYFKDINNMDVQADNSIDLHIPQKFADGIVLMKDALGIRLPENEILVKGNSISYFAIMWAGIWTIQSVSIVLEENSGITSTSSLNWTPYFLLALLMLRRRHK